MSSRQSRSRQSSYMQWSSRRSSYTQTSSGRPSLRRRKTASQSLRKRISQFLSKGGASLDETTTKKTGPYDRAFQQHLIDHDIVPHGYEYPDGRLPPEPDNVDEILEALARPRASLSPSRFTPDDFRRFSRADSNAFKERQVTRNVIPTIEGDVADGRCVAVDLAFANLDHLTDGTLVPGNPDLCYGARPEQLGRRVHKELGGHIMPSTQEDLPIAPNFFLEVKGPDGSTSVAKRQLFYDMALGARGIHTLQSYRNADAAYDNRAYTLGCTYHDGTLKMYASHPIQPVPGGQPGFVTTQIKAWSLSGDADTFRQGVAAFRNGRDWAKRQRDDAIRQANERAHRDHAGDEGRGSSPASDESAGETIVASRETGPEPGSVEQVSCESETSADELSLDPQPPAKRTSLGCL